MSLSEEIKANWELLGPPTDEWVVKVKALEDERDKAHRAVKAAQDNYTECFRERNDAMRVTELTLKRVADLKEEVEILQKANSVLVTEGCYTEAEKMERALRVTELVDKNVELDCEVRALQAINVRLEARVKALDDAAHQRFIK